MGPWGDGCLLCGNIGAFVELEGPKGSGKGAANLFLKRGKAMLIVWFLVCIQDLSKCCLILGCCSLTAPVGFRAGEEETPLSLY